MGVVWAKVLRQSEKMLDVIHQHLIIGERERANLVVQLARFFCIIGEREQAYLVVQLARFFAIYIYNIIRR